MKQVFYWMRATNRTAGALKVEGARQVVSVQPPSPPADSDRSSNGDLVTYGHTIRHFAINSSADFILEDEQSLKDLSETQIPVRQSFDFFSENPIGAALGFSSAEEARKYAHKAGSGSQFDDWKSNAESVILVSLTIK